jgi:cell division protein DivIC
MKSIPGIFKNKYFIAFTAFMAWMLFFDDNNFIEQFNRFQKLYQLKESSAYFTEKINAASAELKRRESDPAAYERIAREKYYMKKANEDVFIFEE